MTIDEITKKYLGMLLACDVYLGSFTSITIVNVKFLFKIWTLNST